MSNLFAIVGIFLIGMFFGMQIEREYKVTEYSINVEIVRTIEEVK